MFLFLAIYWQWHIWGMDLGNWTAPYQNTGLQGWGAWIICFSLSASLPFSSTFRPGSAIEGSYQSVVDEHLKKNALYCSVNVFSTLVVRF